jgi:alginate O-acetyltransferase complex protein AlgI
MFLGFRQFVFGLFKKVFIADRIAVCADTVFENAGVLSGATVWIGVVCYAIQIYCDFSGYSDMAIGIARSLGYDFCENFSHPYISRNITEFWRRWHISLSTWLRDYLYIPLGGSRRGGARTYINLLLTMLLGGLWHGAGLNFIFWGFWHGLMLIIHKMTGPVLDHIRPKSGVAKVVWNLGSWALTMLIVLVGWVFFRAPSFAQAVIVLRQMFIPLQGCAWYYSFALGIIPLFILMHGIHITRWGQLKELPADRWYGVASLFILLFLVVLFFPRGFQPFIYFQF